MKKLIFALLCLSLLNGCATYFEQSGQTDCLTTHWLEAGFDAAKIGKSKTQSWGELDQSCGQYNMWSDIKSFNEGYRLGLEKFCTRSNGFEFGQRNQWYSSVACPSDLQAIFDKAYNDGQRLYESTYNIETATENLAYAQNEISEGRARRRHLKKRIASEDLDKADKKKLVKERYSLKSQISSAKSSLSGYRSDIAQYTREQAALEYQLFEKYYNYSNNDEADHAENNGYSAIETITATALEINEPAILLYKPRHMEGARKSHYKKLSNKINKYMSDTVDRSFRYQVVRNIELVFSPGSEHESRTTPANDFQNPALLFWDGDRELKAVELLPEITEPPLAELARFIQLTARDKILVADAGELAK